MRANIERHRGELNINLLTAKLGFQEKGYIIEYFEHGDVPELAIDPDDVCCGGIPTMTAIWTRLGVQLPMLPSVPNSLLPFAKRQIFQSTIGAARDSLLEGKPLFIKPLPLNRKLFNGLLIQAFKDLLPTARLPPETPVMASEPMDFRSEHRVFVLDREILGIRHYKGDFRLFPDFGVIDAAIHAFADCPVAYGIDFGITAKGDTALVEVNDSYSLGCYGLTPLFYASMIEARWREIVAVRVNR